MGRVAVKVALITGAARGRGHKRARRLALAGADIVAMPVPYATPDEIRQHASRHAEAVDSRVLVGLVALFVENVQVGRDGRGREALAAWFDSVLRTFGLSIHAEA